MTLHDNLRLLAEHHDVNVRHDEPMARHTTFGIGGPADFFLTANDENVLREAVRAAKTASAPIFVLGSGSNILVGDGGIRGVVIEDKVHSVHEPVVNGIGVRLRVGAGASFARLARSTARDGFMRDYYIVVAPDCCAQGDVGRHEAALKAIDGPFGVLARSDEVLGAWAELAKPAF